MILISTAPKDVASTLALSLVENKIAACVNLSEIKSIYSWKGEIVADNEVLMIIKGKFKKVRKFFKRAHPYEVFELIELKNTRIDKKYKKWLKQALKD